MLVVCPDCGVVAAETGFNEGAAAVEPESEPKTAVRPCADAALDLVRLKAVLELLNVAFAKVA